MTAWVKLQACFYGYAVAGDPSALTHGDYYAGKGIGQAILQTPAGLLTVFNTHICANYSHKYTGKSDPVDCHHTLLLASDPTNLQRIPFIQSFDEQLAASHLRHL